MAMTMTMTLKFAHKSFTIELTSTPSSIRKKKDENPIKGSDCLTVSNWVTVSRPACVFLNYEELFLEGGSIIALFVAWMAVVSA